MHIWDKKLFSYCIHLFYIRDTVGVSLNQSTLQNTFRWVPFRELRKGEDEKNGEEGGGE